MIERSLVTLGDTARVQHVLAKARRGEPVSVAVIGGSITQGASATKVETRYGNLVAKWWQEHFPQAQISFHNAGIGATGSNFGALRLKRDLLSHKPDFVVVEYGVNDGNGEEFAETLEGLLRQLLDEPQQPAVMLLFMMNMAGGNAQEWHGKVGNHYNLPMVSYRDMLWPEIEAGRLKWTDISPDEIHPNDRGHAWCARIVGFALEKVLSTLPPDGKLSAIKPLPEPLISDDFQYVALREAGFLNPVSNQGWTLTNTDPVWGFWSATEPGSVIEFELAGTRLMLMDFHLRGPMGIVKVQVDGLPAQNHDTWFPATWGGCRHTWEIAKDLPPGLHKVRLELLAEKNPESEGTEVRVFGLGAAGVKEPPVIYEEFRPGQVWLDDTGSAINAHGGGLLYHEGLYYWYGEHKVAGEAGNVAWVGVHCYSSRDLYNWKDEGIALSSADYPGTEIAPGNVIERPKVIYNAKTGKFVMWFHLELAGQGYSAARSGVAVSDTPAGPFQFVKSFRPNAGVYPANAAEEWRHLLTDEEKAELGKLDLWGAPVDGLAANLLYRRDFESGQMARDMTLFVDDDGTAWHVYSSEENSTLQFSKLTDDYLAPAGEYYRVLVGDWNEAPALFKWKGKYWLISSGCTGWAPNAARLAVSDKLSGPWTPLGNPCRGSEEQTSFTFGTQSTYVLPVQGKKDAFIFCADRWQPQNAIDGRYVWLPILFDGDKPCLEWFDAWDLSVFD